MVYTIKRPYSPLVLVLLFAIAKYFEDHSIINMGSRWNKGVSYLGLGTVSLIGIWTSTNNVSVSYYVVTMCFIEFVDLCFDWKSIKMPNNKKHIESLGKIHTARLKKARTTKSNKKA